jgi:hypothetical protein
VLLRRLARDIAANSSPNPIGAEKLLNLDMEEALSIDLIGQLQLLTQVIHATYTNIQNEQIPRRSPCYG